MLSADRPQPPAAPSGPGKIRAVLHGPLIVIGAVTVIIAAAQFVLDALHIHADPVLSDGFKLALGSLIATVAADRVLAARAQNGVQ